VTGVKKQNDAPFRVGMIYNPAYVQDYSFYNSLFVEIKQAFKESVEFVFVGYNPSNTDILEGFKYDYVKPVSIIHYFKQLQSLELDLIFIPLISNEYNYTSENYNKYLEAGMMGIPILVEDIFPYNQLIKDNLNGFIHKGKEDAVNYLSALIESYNLVQYVGGGAKKDVEENYNYSPDTMSVISELFVK
jgi:hypothetical protein